MRTGDQVGRTDEIEELLARQPLPATHHLVLHHRDVRGGATERGEAELAEQQRELAERRAHTPQSNGTGYRSSKMSRINAGNRRGANVSSEASSSASVHHREPTT